jgi:hypothetical protein
VSFSKQISRFRGFVDAQGKRGAELSNDRVANVRASAGPEHKVVVRASQLLMVATASTFPRSRSFQIWHTTGTNNTTAFTYIRLPAHSPLLLVDPRIRLFYENPNLTHACAHPH